MECSKGISQMKLPSLTHVAFKNEQFEDWDDSLLVTHGHQIQSFEARKPTINKKSVLRSCPNLVTFGCNVSYLEDRVDPFMLHSLSSTAGISASTLSPTDLSMPSPTSSWGTNGRRENDWETFFSMLDVESLSVLHEVCLPTYDWPTKEHEIKKSLWARWTETLSARGVKLTDKERT
ncbi:hypothetical protein B0H11DRAFT_1944121 [Mycena galericulata]|nr:hypothetical protein B0H11DRAFT_1944121 [Mycena galericulata]